MLTELAVIDWIALVFAAVLLAAAIAAAVLAYMTSSHGQLPALSTILNRHGGDDGSSDAEPIEPSDPSMHQRSAWLTPPPVPEHARRRPSHARDNGAKTTANGETADTPPVSDVDRRLAERAARLRGRPVPEPSSLIHTPRVLQVSESRTPAHAATPAGVSSGGVSGEAEHFDSVEGFSARNPGFFEDPLGRHELRYWDGHTWTEYVKESGERFTDPL